MAVSLEPRDLYAATQKSLGTGPYMQREQLCEQSVLCSKQSVSLLHCDPDDLGASRGDAG